LLTFVTLKVPRESCSHLLKTNVLTILQHLADKALSVIELVPLNLDGTSAKEACQILRRSCTKRLASFWCINSSKSDSMGILVAVKNIDGVAINYRHDLTG
jgi:hypothetical protein